MCCGGRWVVVPDLDGLVVAVVLEKVQGRVHQEAAEVDRLLRLISETSENVVLNGM